MFFQKKARFVAASVLAIGFVATAVFAYHSLVLKSTPWSSNTVVSAGTQVSAIALSHQSKSTKAQKLGIGGSVPSDSAGVEIEVDSDRGWFDIEFNDLPALTDGRFTATNQGILKSASLPAVFNTPVSTTSPLKLDVTSSFVASAPVTKVIRIYARAKTDNSLGRAEVLVTTTDGTVVCTKVAMGREDAVCDTLINVNLLGNGSSENVSYKFYASNSGRTTANTSLSAAIVDNTDVAGSISGPTKADAFESVKARYTYNHRATNRIDLQIRFVRVYSAPGVLVKEVPVITRWNGKSYTAMPILGLPGTMPYEMSSTFADREVVDRAFVDVPVNAQSVTFKAQRSAITPPPASGISQDIDLYISQSVFPNLISVVPAAAITNALPASNNSLTSESITVTNPAAGRWYVIGKSKLDERMGMRISATFNSFSAAPDFKFGHYYNPARSGHGVYIDKVAGQWVLLWYAYLQDGTPTWYIAEGVAPGADQGNSIWEADLKRVVWNGSNQFYYTIGSVRVVLLGETSFQFNYIVDGEAGGETFTRLGRAGCTNSAGRPFDVSGLWYSPSKPGFGYSAEVIGNYEFIPAYLYDQNGMPRWLVGEKAFVDGVSTLDMSQLSGFCPLCTYRAPTSKVVGTLARTVTPAASPDNLPGYGTIGVSANFAWPLRGNWNENLPVTMLADRKACK
jgi:hypothetical protein